MSDVGNDEVESVTRNGPASSGSVNGFGTRTEQGSGQSPGPGSGSVTGTAKSKEELAEEAKKKDPKHRIEWSPENEEILVEWCDVAMCYKWMHTRSQQVYSRLHAWFTIPAIILSTVSGTASFAQTSLPVAYQAYSPMAIGAINIFVGIFATIQQYLKVSELNEAYRVSSIAWDKYSRNIRIELAKAPLERTDAYSFLKYSREEFDRLMETSPAIQPSVVKEFMKRFSGESSIGFSDELKQARFNKLNKPDICDIIVSAEENRHPWYKEVEHLRKLALEAEAEAILQTSATTDTNDQDDENEMELRIQRDIILRQDLLRQQEDDLREKMRVLAQKEQEMELGRVEAERHRTEEAEQERVMAMERQQDEERARKTSQEQSVSAYIAQFVDNAGRHPLAEELQEHFQGIIDDETLQPFLSNV